MTHIKPMLACSASRTAQFEKLRFPMMVSPKLDGIRLVIHPEDGPRTRTAKPVPNHYVRNFLEDPLLAFLDGEVIVGEWDHQNAFSATQSGVNSYDGTPDFTFFVFDSFHPAVRNQGFAERHLYLAILIEQLPEYLQERVVVLPHTDVLNMAELEHCEATFVEQGFEGLMSRDPNAPYKFGRSNFSQQGLVKVKRIEDAEAVILGWGPLIRKDGFVEEEMVGNLHVRAINGPHEGKEFHIGSGFKEAQRHELAASPIKGKTLTYEFQMVGSVDKPRFPIFKGFRPEMEV